MNDLLEEYLESYTDYDKDYWDVYRTDYLGSHIVVTTLDEDHYKEVHNVSCFDLINFLYSKLWTQNNE